MWKLVWPDWSLRENSLIISKIISPEKIGVERYFCIAIQSVNIICLLNARPPILLDPPVT